MKIAIDITFLKDQYSGRGIGRYGLNITSGLVKIPNHEWHLLGFDDEKSNLRLLKTRKGDKIVFHSLGKTRPSNVFNSLFFSLKYLPIIKKVKPDLYFATHMERGLPIGKTRVAVVVHDIVPLVTNKYSSKGGIFNSLKGDFYRNNLIRAREADLIITISEFSKNELVNKGGFDPKKIVVTPLAVSENFFNDASTEEEKDKKRTLMTYRITRPYFLYYGGLEPNKNIETLISSFQRISQRHPDLKLVIVSNEFKLGWDNKAHPQTKTASLLFEKIKKLQLEHRVHFPGRIDEKHMTTLLQNAEAFVHLSEYEGFGLSVLEALAAGAPVIAANKTSYPEVLGDAAILVEPKNEKQISLAMNRILIEQGLRKEMRKKGLARAKQFSWTKTTEMTVSSFENLYSSTRGKVGIVIPFFYPQKGGAEHNALSLGKRLAKDNYQVEVFTSGNKGLPAEEEYEGIRIHRFKKLNNSYYLLFYPGLLFKLLHTKLDYVHSIGIGFLWQDFCLIIKKIFSKHTRFINTPHGPFMSLPDYGIVKNLIKKIFSSIIRLYANSLFNIMIDDNDTQKEWMSSLYGMDRKKIRYVPNGIDTELLEELNTKKIERQYRLAGKTVISYVGRFNKYKGVDQVLNVLPELTKKYKDIMFFIMGRDVTEKVVYEMIIKENKLKKYVKILENPSDEIRDQIVQRSDISILPSQWEAFGIVIVEAMAKRNAIISTRTEGGNFLIKEEENGYLFDFGNLEELKQKFVRLFKSKTRIEKIKNTNFKKVKNFLWDEIYEKNYKPLFEKTISN
ncbi:glycosyltransferase [Candidatus Dojkabacteria bacterium]|nr:glycosyltransferase [Candidatus Dojkabacteria bacterium]